MMHTRNNGESVKRFIILLGGMGYKISTTIN